MTHPKEITVPTISGSAGRIIRRNKLHKTILDYLGGNEPEKITRIDASELLDDPDTWNRPFDLVHALRVIIASQGDLYRFWHVTNDALRLHILDDKFGAVYAYGKPGDPNRTCYLAVMPEPDGLAFHPPLTAEKIARADAAYAELNAARDEAMEDELAILSQVIDDLRANLAPTVLTPQAELQLRAIRLERWALTTLDLAPADRAKRIMNLFARLTAITHTTIFNIEDLLAGASRKIAG